MLYWRRSAQMLGELIGTVRRNHALEHATIAVLLRRIGHDIRMVGRATRDGYYLYADVPTELLEESTREALYRLKSGEGHLAVSSLCGTNLAVAGALAGAASLVTMGGARLVRVPVAQRTEQLPSKQRVAGSSPAGDATAFFGLNLLGRVLALDDDAGHS